MPATRFVTPGVCECAIHMRTAVFPPKINNIRGYFLPIHADENEVDKLTDNLQGVGIASASANGCVLTTSKGISQEVSRDALGHVSKECDKQGFPMTQGVLTSGGVRLLIYRGESSKRNELALNCAIKEISHKWRKDKYQV
ncbi:hypothetical protein C5167_017485 [Papaver somniferum]|uniref:Uncharacterized protein n=1 Tax=Papaver somniferum TaxID=3469 RepID=A0A4Y7INK3_PAPSO|nr:hypothetical protein C5167_017485 [Papaver somniferum]